MSAPSPLALDALGERPSFLARSDDATRIRDLEVVVKDDPALVRHALDWANARWSLGADAPMQFRPIQAVSLWTVHSCGGAILPIGTGHGKTLLSMLAAEALGSLRPLILLPPAMLVSFKVAMREYRSSFRIPGNLRWLAYSSLSSPKASSLLKDLRPDVLVGDEAHNLRYFDAARTKRVNTYMTAHPDTRCVWMSGTLTSSGIKDYAHLAEWALKHKSPLPRTANYNQMVSFGAVLDAKATRESSGGARYVSSANSSDWVRFSPLFPDWESYDGDVEDVDLDEEDPEARISPRVHEARRRFRARLATCPGVVTTQDPSSRASLLFRRREIHTPEVVEAHLEQLERTWKRPDGEELVDAIAKWRCGRQLSQGFFYRWRWPHGEVDTEWMRTRSAWLRAVREVVKAGATHLDSEANVRRQTLLYIAGDRESLVWGSDSLASAWRDWEPNSRKRWGRLTTPPTETVWLDDFLIKDALAWLQDPENKTGLVWYEDTAVAIRLAKEGVPVYGSGTNPEEIEGRFAAALSLDVHADGKNLQKHNKNLVLSWPTSGKVSEQFISRTHRAGQVADEVWFDYYAHTEPALRAVRESRNYAKYIEDTTGLRQRLCYGNWGEP